MSWSNARARGLAGALCWTLSVVLVACGTRAKPVDPAAPPQPYLTIADGKLHDGKTPPGETVLYVKGRIEADRFIPESNDIDGTGEVGPAPDGQPGWMELADGSFVPAQTARVPRRPYVEGYRLKDGTFRPASRRIVF